MRRLLAAVVAVVALALVVSGCQSLQAYDLPLPGKPVKKSDGYRVTAEFADVVDVVPRTLVMANDVAVGQVESVERDGWNAKVVMTIRKDIVLPADAHADVRQTSLLGEKYISLTPPAGSTVDTAGRLKDGADIPIDRSGRNPEVEEVLGALSFLLSRGGVGQLKTISTELNAMMEQRQGNMRDVLGQLNTLVTSLNQHRSSIIDAMTQVDRLTKTLNAETPKIEKAIDSFGPALKVLHEQHRDLMTMLTSLDQLGTVATHVIDASGANIVSALKSLQPTLSKLAEAGDALPRGLMMAASYPWPKQAEDLARGEYSNALFHMNIDLDQLLTGLTTGSNTGLPQLLQLCSTYAQGCSQLQPLIGPLCTLLQQDFVCSMVGKADASSAAGTKSSKGTAKSKSGTSAGLPNLLNQILGGSRSTGGSSGSSGGLLGGLLGGLGGTKK
ncbi:MCE family protein [Nocardioides sp. Kera G14]|uniref:MCE family protein n=1 Tax=Nocardioides sp. Kera G14 TaxID=2884264 RepID=UPI001D100C15|nr:MCE family protein [Nocardioides sp. Kera G14]UDY22303.1 MCE family protein [Nocardioides sp. Kera G14]